MVKRTQLSAAERAVVGVVGAESVRILDQKRQGFRQCDYYIRMWCYPHMVLIISRILLQSAIARMDS